MAKYNLGDLVSVRSRAFTGLGFVVGIFSQVGQTNIMGFSSKDKREFPQVLVLPVGYRSGETEKFQRFFGGQIENELAFVRGIKQWTTGNREEWRQSWSMARGAGKLNNLNRAWFSDERAETAEQVLIALLDGKTANVVASKLENGIAIPQRITVSTDDDDDDDGRIYRDDDDYDDDDISGMDEQADDQAMRESLDMPVADLINVEDDDHVEDIPEKIQRQVMANFSAVSRLHDFRLKLMTASGNDDLNEEQAELFDELINDAMRRADALLDILVDMIA